jgi:hypothetical protein
MHFLTTSLADLLKHGLDYGSSRMNQPSSLWLIKNAYLPPVEGLNDEATDWLIGLLERTHFVNIDGR